MKDLLVLVPGLAGSRLDRDGRPIWGSSSVGSSLLRPQAALRLRGNGFAVEPDVRAVGLVERLTQFPGLVRIGPYETLLGQLRQHFDLHDGNFVVFPYDWRLSCEVTGRLLADRVRPLLARLPDARLVFLCHSMGGVVVQHATDVLDLASVTRRVITFGTPFRGAVKALGVLRRGWPARLPVIRDRFRRLALTLPSVHEMLPWYKAVVDESTLRPIELRDLGPHADAELFERARSLHHRHELLVDRPYERTVVVGSLQPTAQYARIVDGSVQLLHQYGEAPDRRGDGTVPRQSVPPPEWPDDTRAMPVAQTHLGLPAAASSFRVLLNVLTSDPREEQVEVRAQLALDVPDLVMAGTRVEIRCEVAKGDKDVPMLVQLQPTDARRAPMYGAPQDRDGHMVAWFDEVPPGDYMVTVEPAVRMPDVAPVRDALTVVDPETERPDP